MAARIQELIDKRDNFEIIRDRIAQIITDESANQSLLATTQGKEDPTQWDLRVFVERAEPWEQFQRDQEGREVSDVPIVNVWFERLTFDERRSNVVSRQQGPGVFNIDVYGFGRSTETAEGHDPADNIASLKMQQGIRLIRNILMSGYYVTLGWDLPQKTIGQRFIRSIGAFQPDAKDSPAIRMAAGRIAFEVSFNETSFEYVAPTIQEVSVGIKYAPDGSVLVSADFDYTQCPDIIGTPEGSVIDKIISSST